MREGPQLKAGDFLWDGRLKLLEPLGSGGFATIWKGIDRKRHELVAIKVLHGQHVEDRSRRERFFRGARRMAALQHQGIVRVLEENLEDEHYHFFVMEFLAGGDFHKAVLHKRIPGDERLDIITKVGEALQFAHERRIIHRDIKPANIVLDEQGRPKLTDFDLVRAQDTAALTRFGGALGTWGYAAPELMSKPQDADESADVYGLGMTAVFALYGADLPADILRNTPGFIERLDTSPAIKKVLQRSVEWECGNRFASVVEFCEALAEARKSPLPHSPKNSAPSTIGQLEHDWQKDSRQEKERFDVFLCHHSDNKPEVKKIGKQLITHGLRPWLDEWELRPGFPWQRLLEEQIEKIKTAAVFVGPSGIGPWQQMELDAYLREFVNRKCPVIPVILPGVSKVPRLPVFLAGLTWVDFRLSEPDPLRSLIWGITGERSWSGIKPLSEPIVGNIPSQPPQTHQPGLQDKLKDGSPAPKMVWLPGGMFTMGEDESPDDDEKPAHEVTVGAFSLSQYPVTFEEYDRFCEATRRKKRSDSSWGRGTRPAIDVSWKDAAAYCEWISKQTGEHYRLPTEAEWEYACRAGSATRYCFGDDEQPLSDYAWYSENAEGKTHPVGEKLPNDWQLYDMHGNVWEWVRDWYGSYSAEPQTDPSGPETGSHRVRRGGSWSGDADGCRSAFRYYGVPGGRYIRLGFRLARDGTWPSDTFTLTAQKAAETFVQAESEAKQEKSYKPYQGFRDFFKDRTEAPEMVYLPGGSFKMGDVQGKGHKDETPVHQVTLGAFAIGRNPLTVGEFRRFVEATGYQTEAEQQGGAYVYDGEKYGDKSDANWRNPYMSQDDDHPVVCISWNDAIAYCEWLCEQTGAQYSLPTEAEWEYACRAESETAYCFGDDEKLLKEYAWFARNAKNKTHPVGRKKPNAWGLHDMHGNVWEWVQDLYGNYSKESQRNPSGPETGSYRVGRGGSWLFDA